MAVNPSTMHACITRLELGEGERLAPVVEVHDADADDTVQDAGDKPDGSDERGPVVARDYDNQQENGEHHGAVQECAPVLGGIFTLVGNGAEYGACHHHQEQRQPEHGHARCAEVFNAGEDGVPKLEERGMCAHAVTEGEHGADSPECGPAALAGQEQAEEPEEGEERTRVVVVELETVVAPVERASLASGFGHLAVFAHGDIDKRTALQVARLFVLFVHVHADKSGQQHLREFFLVQGPADGVAVVGVLAFAAHGLRGRVQVRRYQLEAGESKPEGKPCCSKPDAFAAGSARWAMECGLV